MKSTMSKMKNTLNGINGIDITGKKKKINELEAVAKETTQSKTQKKNFKN